MIIFVGEAPSREAGPSAAAFTNWWNDKANVASARKFFADLKKVAS